MQIEIEHINIEMKKMQGEIDIFGAYWILTDLHKVIEVMIVRTERSMR